MLNNKVAIVSGGGRGIGRATALELAKQGVKVAVVDIDGTAAEQVASEIKTSGLQALGFKVDMTDKKQVDKLVEQVITNYERLDFMVNNAGTGSVAPFLELGEQEWDRVMSINVKSVLFGTQAAARVMVEQKIQGRIINMSSVAGKGGRPLLAAYAASKAAVISLTQSAAYALAQYKITVNCICPGVVSTDMGDKVLSKMKYYADIGEVSESQSKVPPAPLGQVASPEDVARMVVYLVGEGGSYITGQSINVDGGRCVH